MRTVKDIMSDYVECVRPTATVKEAAGRMRAFDVGILPVCDRDRLIGVITDRDIATRVTALGKTGTFTTVAIAMTRDPICCSPDLELEGLVAMMQVHQLRRFPVTDGEGRVIGLVSLADLSRAGEDEQAAQVLKALMYSIQAVFMRGR